MAAFAAPDPSARAMTRPARTRGSDLVPTLEAEWRATEQAIAELMPAARTRSPG